MIRSFVPGASQNVWNLVGTQYMSTERKAFARLLSRILTPIYNFTSTELYRSNRLFNSLSSGFPFIYLMISRAKKNSKIFLLLFVFSFIRAPLSKVNLAISLRNLYTVRTYFCFQRFGGIGWGLIERRI